jgi:hypothetical protein
MGGRKGDRERKLSEMVDRTAADLDSGGIFFFPTEAPKQNVRYLGLSSSLKEALPRPNHRSLGNSIVCDSVVF